MYLSETYRNVGEESYKLSFSKNYFLASGTIGKWLLYDLYTSLNEITETLFEKTEMTHLIYFFLLQALLLRCYKLPAGYPLCW